MGRGIPSAADQEVWESGTSFPVAMGLGETKHNLHVLTNEYGVSRMEGNYEPIAYNYFALSAN